MTKHVPLFLPLGSIRLLTIFFSFCIIFVHPALADKMAESPELFDTAFTLQERLDIPDGFVQREMVYISILLGTLVLCLFFFFMQRRMKKLRERDRERYLQLLEGILDNLPIAAKVKDVNDGMRYTFWNKKAEELFECSAREAIGKTDFETMPEAAALIRKEDEELVKTGIPQEGIRRFFTKKNEERFTFQNNNFIKLSDGRKWIVYTAWDITDLKIMERKLRLAKEEAEESNRIKSAFLANMSHEIRTPLNAIVGFSSILATEVSEEERVEYLDIIERNNELLLQLINDILDLSKIEAGTLEYVRQPMNLGEVCRNIYQIHKDRVQEGVTLILDNEDDDLIIEEDRNRIAQVITNFLTNAGKFTLSGEIRFGFKVDNQCIRFYVKDTGIGIAPDKVGHIFDRFVKLNSFAQGTGLGLAICRMIIEKIGGEIGATSEVGKGSTFFFTIPYKEHSDDRIAFSEVSETKYISHTIKRVQKIKKILVAEDVDSNFVLIKNMIGKDYTLLWAKDGFEAVEMYKQFQPDLILMDIKMPRMGGLEATRIIRSYSKEIPVIALTAYAFEADKEQALEAGCNDFVTKPVSKAALEEALGKCSG